MGEAKRFLTRLCQNFGRQSKTALCCHVVRTSARNLLLTDPVVCRRIGGPRQRRRPQGARGRADARQLDGGAQRRRHRQLLDGRQSPRRRRALVDGAASDVQREFDAGGAGAFVRAFRSFACGVNICKLQKTEHSRTALKSQILTAVSNKHDVRAHGLCLDPSTIMVGLGVQTGTSI